jgi:transposase InsO family protein
MNVHSLAKTTPLCRWTIVKRVMIQYEPVAAVARDNSISCRTVFKWLRRFRCEGFLGLFDRRSRPHRSPQRLPQYLLLYIRWRRFKEQTAAAIAETINCARSTVARWIRLLGFCKSSERKPAEAVQRYEHEHPGDMLHLDIKRLARIEKPGKRVTGDPSQRSRGGGWEQLHVCIDDHSRVAVEEILPDATGATAAAFLERCVAFFARCGVTVKRVLTDNGPCYHSRKFKRACCRLGIRNSYTRPYHPQTNGKVERFIRTTLNEWAWPTRFESSHHRKQDLLRWLVHYNLKRKHSSLGHRPPASRLETVNNVLGVNK